MSDFTFSLQRLLNTPLATTPRHAAMVVSAVRSRLGFKSIRLNGVDMGPEDMDAFAAAGRVEAVDSRAMRTRRVKSFDEAGPIAIIPIHGSLTKSLGGLDPESGQTGYNQIEQKLSAASADPDVKAIWLDVDSGGGEVGGMIGLSRMIYAASERNGGKPIWAMAADYAYSAAYGLASAADRVIVPPTGGVGSVGVIMLHADMSKAYAAEGIDVTVIRSGKDKALVNPHEPLGDESLALLQSQMDEIRDIFADHVALYRGLSKKTVLETEGLDYMGQHARAIRFVDDVMWEQEAFALLVQQVS